MSTPKKENIPALCSNGRSEHNWDLWYPRPETKRKGKMITVKRVMSATEQTLREQNAKLRDIIRELHVLARVQTSFMLGILTCELIENGSENCAFERADRMLGSTMAEVTKLATQDVVGK